MVLRTVIAVALLGGMALTTAQPAVAQQSGFSVPAGPRTSWRGRIHIRNGPFASVYREHWGNGITDNGLALGNTIVGGLVTVLPPVLDRIIGQGVQQGIEYDPAGDACTPAEVPSNDVNYSSRTVALATLKKNQMELLASLGIKDDQYPELLTPPAPDQDVIEWDGGPAAQRAGHANPQRQQAFQNQQQPQQAHGQQAAPRAQRRQLPPPQPEPAPQP
jgi:hypothetical protein